MSFNKKFDTIVGINPIEEFMCLNYPDNLKPFKKDWLNNAHLETLLPGSSWEKVYDLIIPELCQQLNSQFTNESRKQALFELLGKHFVSKFFPLYEVDPTVTRPPVLSTEESIKLYHEAKTWLDTAIERIVNEKGIYDKTNQLVCPEVNDYIAQARYIFLSNFKKELARREAEYFKKISTSKPSFRTADLELHHKPETAVSSIYDRDLPNTVQSLSIYGPEMMIAPLPHCISFQSEFIGESLVALCRSNNSQIEKISKVMSGRRLPISLRKYLWKNVLLLSQSPIYDKEINYEELLREKFARAVTRGMTELKISTDIKSPVNELLENLIIEHYEKSASLNKYCEDVHFLSEAVKILNILYTYDRSYDPHFVFWLFPLHFGLKEDADSLPMNGIPFLYDIAMYLNLMNNVYPAWSDIFNISEKVFQRLMTVDSELATHLANVAQKNVLSQPKDFLAQIMDLEINKAKMKRLSRVAKEDSSNDIRGFEVLKSPIIFIRKWIGEGFVSVLGAECVLFIFDQLFMEKFSPLVFEDSCLSIILLLKHRFLLTEDHQEMKTVFLDYPSSIITLDFIRAWVCIHKNDNPDKVSAMNRRETFKYVPANVVTPPPPPTIKQIVIIPSISLNDVRLKLIFSASNDEEVSLVNSINANMLSVQASLYLGDSKVKVLKTSSSPDLKTTIKEGNQIINSFRFNIGEIIEFDSIDVSDLAGDFKEGDQLSIVASVLLTTDGENVKTLGWCRLPCVVEDTAVVPKWSASQLMRPAEEMSLNHLMTYVSKLKVKRFRHQIPLFSGDVPIDFMTYNNYSTSGPLLNGSVLGIYSFDKTVRPYTPPPETPRVIGPVKSPTPIPRQEEVIKPRTQEEEDFPETVQKEDPGEPIKDNDAWIPFKPEAFALIQPPISSKFEPFCLYIDQIRFLPDTATIVKVTGRFFQTGYDENIPDILIFPNVESEPRSPTFMASSRVIINQKKTMNLNKDSILILRVYTVLKTSLEIAVVGNVIVPIFDEAGGILLSGCFQKRLRNQMPNVGLVNAKELKKNSLDRAPYVDCLSITYRLWPFTTTAMAAPDYLSGVYESSDCNLTKFEWDIFSLYKKDKEMMKSYKEIVKDIKLRDANPEFKNQAVSHSFMFNFFPYRLDLAKFLQKDQVPQHISTELMFHYRIEKGININVTNVYGIKDAKLLFVTTKVMRGIKTASIPPRPSLNYGTDEFQIFSKLDPKSFMTASKWTDSFQMINPYFDDQDLLVIQVWGVSATIRSGQFIGTIDGKPLTTLTKDHLVGWTAIKLFKHGFIDSGKHQLPLFNIRLHHALLKRFQAQPIVDILQKEEEFKNINPCSIVLYLLDGHRGVDQYPSNKPMLTELLDNCPCGRSPFITATVAANNGKTVAQEVNEIIPDADVAAQNKETKLTLFQKYFSGFAQKLVASVPPKQPYVPILF